MKLVLVGNHYLNPDAIDLVVAAAAASTCTVRFRSGWEQDFPMTPGQFADALHTAMSQPT
jgi:hypothetical protein